MIRELVLWFMLSACAYRGTRLVTRDTFPPVLWLRDRLAGGWRPLTGKEVEQRADWWAVHANDPHAPMPSHLAYGAEREINGVQNRYVRRKPWSPYWLAELIICPWCASAYVSGILVAATDLSVGVQWPWLMGGAVWAGAALLGSREWA